MLAGGALTFCDIAVASATKCTLACTVIPDFLTQIQTLNTVNLFFLQRYLTRRTVIYV
jgi:hypothetical protein